MENQKQDTREDEDASLAKERERNFGKIIVSDLITRDTRMDDALKLLFRVFIPFRAEHKLCQLHIEYDGYSIYFDTIDENGMLPVYMPIFSKGTDNKLKIAFEKYDPFIARKADVQTAKIIREIEAIKRKENR